jgi:hypothetical protein
MSGKLQNKVTDLESIEKFGTTARPCCDRKKIKRPMYYFGNRKRKRIKQELTKFKLN